MIRRGFWLVAGAAIGVTGYRKATRVAQSLWPARPPLPARPARPGRPGAALVPAGAAPRPPVITGRGVLAAAAAAGRGTVQGVAFARDVREGMAEYLERQGVDTGRTLDSQRGRPQPGRP
jgi:hypothetical protein